jgi:hypothetical protein
MRFVVPLAATTIVVVSIIAATMLVVPIAVAIFRLAMRYHCQSPFSNEPNFKY